MRTSATVLESFRLFMQPDQDWMPESEILATIRGEFTPTPKMLLGQAFGRCLEKPAKYFRGDAYIVPVKCGDEWVQYRFQSDAIDRALSVIDRNGIFETKIAKRYGDVVVVNKVDQILGTTITENKATLSSFDFDKYAESCQWRFYLDAFEGSTSVRYNVFLLGEPDAGDYELKSIESFSMFPYPELHQDCCELVNRFVDYVAAQGLIGALEERQRVIEREYAREI